MTMDQQQQRRPVPADDRERMPKQREAQHPALNVLSNHHFEPTPPGGERRRR